jgi:antitoxin ParD1/3/4
MTVTLTRHHQDLIERMIASGQYEDAEQVIGQALRLLEEHEQGQQLRAKLQTGIDQLDRGEGILFTPEWSAERHRVLRERVAAGETPNPDVCP